MAIDTSQFRYSIDVSLPQQDSGKGVTDGAFPLILPDSVGENCNEIGSDVVITDADNNPVPFRLYAKGHVANLNGIVFSQLTNPRAIYDANTDRTFLAIVNDQALCEVVQFDHSNGNAKTHYVIQDTPFNKDDHNGAVLGLRSDGRILAMWTGHPGDVISIRVSTNPGDISSWGPITNITPGIAEDLYSYMELHHLADEGTIGRFHCFVRETVSGKVQWLHITSDDDGETWSEPDTYFVQTNSKDPYLFTASDGESKLLAFYSFDTVVFRETDEDRNKGLYCLKYEDGEWFNMNGAAAPSQPFADDNVNASSILFDFDEGEEKWNWDASFNADGDPVVIWVDYVNYDPDRSEAWHGRWDGSTWQKHKICELGNAFVPPTSDSYSGSPMFDPQNANHVYLPQDIEGVREIVRFITTDAGETWTRDKQFSFKSEKPNFRPIIPRGRVDGKTPSIFWVGNGRYPTFRTYETLMRQWPVVNPAKWALVETSLSDSAETILRIWFGSDNATDYVPDSRVGAGIGFTQLSLGSVPLTKDKHSIWGDPTGSDAEFRAGAYINDEGVWPRIEFDTTGRIGIFQEFRNSPTASMLMIGACEATGTNQHIFAANSTDGHFFFRISTTGNTDFRVFRGNDVFEQNPSPGNFPIGAEDDELLYTHYDGPNGQFATRVGTTETIAASASNDNLSNNFDSAMTAVGLSSGPQGAAVQGWNGGMIIMGVATVTLPKAYTDTLRAAMLSPDDFATYGDLIERTITADQASASYLGTAYRQVNDAVPIEFVWDRSDATITGTRGDGTPIAGLITFLRTENGQHWYRIAYNAGDGRSTAGVSSYTLTDGVQTRNLNLQVTAAAKDVESFTPGALAQLSAVKFALLSPFEPDKQRLTLVQTTDYKSSTPIGALEFNLSSWSYINPGDTILFAARLNDGQTIEASGTAVDVDGTLIGRVELSKDTDTNRTLAETSMEDINGRWQLNHRTSSGTVSALYAGKQLRFLRNLS